MPGITLTEEEVRKLTSCGNPDAAVLFLYRKAELPRETALAALHFTVPRMVGATDTSFVPRTSHRQDHGGVSGNDPVRVPLYGTGSRADTDLADADAK